MFDFDIYPADNCPPDLFRFRYKIYVEEMRRPQRYACHKTKTIIDPLDAYADQVVASKDGEIVACIRANLLRKGPVGDYLALYGMDKLTDADRSASSICTRLMVAKNYRKSPVLTGIFQRLYVFGLANFIETSYIDCNRHLVGFFEKFGYEFLSWTHHHEYGDVAVMRLFLNDFERLIDIGSPFAEISRRHLGGATAFAPAV